MARCVLSLALLFSLVGLTACATGRLAPVNLFEAGWTVRQGQAVWQRQAGAPEIAGDLTVAGHADGRTWVQFSKTPFPLLTAQTAPDRWQMEIHMQNRRFAGPGTPPSRVMWLHLVHCLNGARPPKGWSFSQPGPQEWRLENLKTGERIEGLFLP